MGLCARDRFRCGAKREADAFAAFYAGSRAISRGSPHLERRSWGLIVGTSTASLARSCPTPSSKGARAACSS